MHKSTIQALMLLEWKDKSEYARIFDLCQRLAENIVTFEDQIFLTRVVAIELGWKAKTGDFELDLKNSWHAFALPRYWLIYRIRQVLGSRGRIADLDIRRYLNLDQQLLSYQSWSVFPSNQVCWEVFCKWSQSIEGPLLSTRDRYVKHLMSGDFDRGKRGTKEQNFFKGLSYLIERDEAGDWDAFLTFESFYQDYNRYVDMLRQSHPIGVLLEIVNHKPKYGG